MNVIATAIALVTGPTAPDEEDIDEVAAILFPLARAGNVQAMCLYLALRDSKHWKYYPALFDDEEGDW